MIGPRGCSLAVPFCQALRNIAFRACYLILLPATSTALAAQVNCLQSTVVNRVAVQFLAGKEKIPPSLILINDGTPRKVKIQVADRGDGYWVCESCEPLIGDEHQLRPDLNISGYAIAPARGVNRLLGGKCYAIFDFTLVKIPWMLEVSPTPSFPFQFKANGAEYVLRFRELGGNDWNLIDGLSLDVPVSLKIYEIREDKTIYLFTLDFLPRQKELHQNPDQIAERVLRERIRYRYGNQLPKDLDPADPYLEIAKSQKRSNSDSSDKLAKLAVIKLLQLQSLDLRGTEVKP